jgi:hypothetical protein
MHLIFAAAEQFTELLSERHADAKLGLAWRCTQPTE